MLLQFFHFCQEPLLPSGQWSHSSSLGGRWPESPQLPVNGKSPRHICVLSGRWSSAFSVTYKTWPPPINWWWWWKKGKYTQKDSNDFHPICKGKVGKVVCSTIKSLTPTSCPTNQFNSDTNYPELVQGNFSTRRLLPLTTQLQVLYVTTILHTSAQLATNSGLPQPSKVQ